MADPAAFDHPPPVRPAAVLIATGLGLLVGGTAPARADPPPAATAIARSRAAALSESEAWQRLLLYDGRAGGDRSSQVDDPSFFLAESGRDDPRAELEATLAGFFAPVTAGREDDHALCRFPARRRWLDQQLGIDPALPSFRCPAQERFTSDLDATSVSLVYASNHFDNPSSAFGHNLLRLHRRRAAPGVDTDAEDRGLDYTAITDTRNPVVYAAKGLTGGFAGWFRVSPYDVMLREYGMADVRDVWEYELALEPAEVRLLVLHLWELSNARIDYLYLGENCSYRIVAAIDAAAPRLDLGRHLGSAVLPLDAVQAALATPGLVRRLVYRPSVRSTLRAAVAPLTRRERDLVDGLLDDQAAPLPTDLPPDRRALVLDAAVRVVDARRAAGMLAGDDTEGLARRRLLAARRDAEVGRDAAIPAEDGGLLAPPPTPFDAAPHRSHAPMRLHLGTGVSSQYGNGHAQLGVRVALHDLADPPDGQPELVQLQFLDTVVRFDHRRGVLGLERLTFAELMAINPLTRFEERLSWRFRAQGSRLHDDGCHDCFAHGLDGALGVAVASDDEHAALFAMAQLHAVVSPHLRGIDDSFVRVGLGPLVGGRLRLPADTVALVTGTWSALPGQAGGHTFDLRGSLRARLARNVALGLEGAAQPRSAEAQLGSWLYF